MDKGRRWKQGTRLHRNKGLTVFGPLGAHQRSKQQAGQRCNPCRHARRGERALSLSSSVAVVMCRPAGSKWTRRGFSSAGSTLELHDSLAGTLRDATTRFVYVDTIPNGKWPSHEILQKLLDGQAGMQRFDRNRKRLLHASSSSPPPRPRPPHRALTERQPPTRVHRGIREGGYAAVCPSQSMGRGAGVGKR